MDFRDDQFFHSLLCDIDLDDDNIGENGSKLKEFYNLHCKIRRKRKLFLEKKRPPIERDIYKEFPKE